MPAFSLKNQPKGRGRRKGSRGKAAVLRETQFQSAIEVFRGMGVPLPKLGAQLVEVLNAIALSEVPGQSAETIRTLGPVQKDKLAKYCKIAIDAVAMMMEFSYPKLARVEVSGDPDNPLKVVNEVEFYVTASPEAKIINTNPSRIPAAIEGRAV